jgi:hypothetical protein
MLGRGDRVQAHYEQDVVDCISPTSAEGWRYVSVAPQTILDTNFFIGATLPQETKDKLFITSLENIEYSILLETEARTMKWGWLFRTYVQWHAIAFLLSELCVRTKGEAVERAWRALEATAGRWWFPLSDVTTLPQKQQGCLWKPLRKLLAKAKAARDRELALERASIALRNGQFRNDQFSFEFPNGMIQMSVPPVSASQQSPETLDRMLRPTAPKLGEVPIAEHPSWPNSPVQPRRQDTHTSQNSNGLSKQQKLPNGPPKGSRGSGNSPGQDFGDLFNFGLDNVINDVMGYEPLGPSTLDDYSSFATPSTGLSHSNSLHTSQPIPTSSISAPTAANGYPTFGDGMLPTTSMDFNVDSNGGLAGLGGIADAQQMPENGDMDWTLWDDMVSQYGIEGHPSNPASTAGPGNLGLVHWF